MNLSVVIVAFKSGHLLEKLILSIPKNYEIIIIENSLDVDIKNKFEKFNNVRVIIPNKNLGYGKSFNLGLEISKNNYTYFLSPDVVIPEGCFENINKVIQNLDNFYNNSIYDYSTYRGRRIAAHSGSSSDDLIL